jgi:hypothetical protein
VRRVNSSSVFSRPDKYGYDNQVPIDARSPVSGRFQVLHRDGLRNRAGRRQRDPFCRHVCRHGKRRGNRAKTRHGQTRSERGLTSRLHNSMVSTEIQNKHAAARNPERAPWGLLVRMTSIGGAENAACSSYSRAFARSSRSRVTAMNTGTVPIGSITAKKNIKTETRSIMAQAQILLRMMFDLHASGVDISRRDYSASTQLKLAASFGSPAPSYWSTLGQAQARRAPSGCICSSTK